MTLRRMLRHVDWLVIGACIALTAAGLLFVMSATHAQPVGGDSLYYAKRQAVWAVAGAVALVVAASVDYAWILRMGIWIYVANVAVLGLVLVAGESAYGAQRWLQVGPIRLQPSEFAKIAMIVGLASFLQRKSQDGRIVLKGIRDLIPAFLFVGFPMLLVFRQPDLGTSPVFAGILVGMLYAAGAEPKALFGLLGSIGGAAGLAVFAHYRFGLPIPLHEYQLRRILSFFSPGSDLRYAGYHTHQSQIAIGSGRLLGKGFMAGSQNQLNFLPQRHTDFIFSVIGEELGFVGALFVLALLGFIIYRCLLAARRARDPFGSMIAYGVAILIFFQAVVNIAVNLNLIPVTGISLPFISYGGSGLISLMLGIGLVESVALRHKPLEF